MSPVTREYSFAMLISHVALPRRAVLQSFAFRESFICPEILEFARYRKRQRKIRKSLMSSADIIHAKISSVRLLFISRARTIGVTSRSEELEAPRK
jgi:hypothetical protein